MIVIKKATAGMVIACSVLLIGTASDASQKGSVPLEHLPSTNSQAPLSTYSNTECGIAFKYPKEWQQSTAEDKSVLVKFGGATNDGLTGEVQLGRSSDGSSPEKILSFLNQFAFTKLDNFKKVQDKKVAIGVNRKIAAELEDITFNIAAMKVQQRYVLFQHKGETYSLMFTAPSGHFNALTPVFNDILLSVQTGSGITASTKGVTTKTLADSSEKSVALQNYRSNNLPVSFGYPADWKVVPGSHSDEAVSMQGKSPKGNDAFIVLHRGQMHPTLSIDEVADALQKEYFESQKNFHRVTRQNQNFGRMSKVNGVVQEQTYDKDGAPVKQMVAMFSHGEKAYALSLVAPGWKDSEMHQLFYKVLATVDLQD